MPDLKSDFGIKDLDGVLVARCKGKFPTITGRRGKSPLVAFGRAQD